MFHLWVVAPKDQLRRRSQLVLETKRNMSKMANFLAILFWGIKLRPLEWGFTGIKSNFIFKNNTPLGYIKKGNTEQIQFGGIFF